MLVHCSQDNKRAKPRSRIVSRPQGPWRGPVIPHSRPALWTAHTSLALPVPQRDACPGHGIRGSRKPGEPAANFLHRIQSGRGSCACVHAAPGPQAPTRARPSWCRHSVDRRNAAGTRLFGPSSRADSRNKKPRTRRGFLNRCCTDSGCCCDSAARTCGARVRVLPR